MPKVDPFAYIIDSFSRLTGGLISDMQSAILGCLLIAFILMGLDYLMGVLGNVISSRAADRYMDKARHVKNERNFLIRGSADWDEATQLYRHYISKAAKARLRD